MKIVNSKQYIVVRKALLALFVLSLLFTNYYLLTTSVFAAELTEYTLLEPLPIGPGGNVETTTNAGEFLSGIFQLVLSIAVVMAIVRLIYAGIVYMSSDAFQNKKEAKGIITETLIGLGLAICSWLIVFTILPTDENDPSAFTFKLSLDATPLPVNKNPPIGTGGGGGSVGCQGNCPYSYTSGGQTIKYKDCVSCSKASSFGLNIKTLIIDGRDAEMNTSLGNKLKAVQKTTGNPSFRVTETWPPTVNHKNQGQYDGTSVDVGLDSANAPNIIAFLKNAQAKGLSATYEVRSESLRAAYVKLGVPASGIIAVSYISAEHFSIK